jgi:hypothetical protein
MAVLELVVVIRYMDLIRWTEPSAWGYLSLLAVVLATSVAGCGKSEAEHGRHL